MSDPLALFPFALAAGGGLIDGLESPRLIAAGVTLLQRSAPLVRALSGRRSAILLEAGPAFLTALAASDGRGALLLPLDAPVARIAQWLVRANIGVVFTHSAHVGQLPAGTAMVLLDGAPMAARTVFEGQTREIDLGSHFGLSLEGSRDVDGSDDECLVVFDMPDAETPTRWTHRALLAATRTSAIEQALTPMHELSVVGRWSDVATLIATGAAPLYHGARITTRV